MYCMCVGTSPVGTAVEAVVVRGKRASERGVRLDPRSCRSRLCSHSQQLFPPDARAVVAHCCTCQLFPLPARSLVPCAPTVTGIEFARSGRVGVAECHISFRHHSHFARAGQRVFCWADGGGELAGWLAGCEHSRSTCVRRHQSATPHPRPRDQPQPGPSQCLHAAGSPNCVQSSPSAREKSERRSCSVARDRLSTLTTSKPHPSLLVHAVGGSPAHYLAEACSPGGDEPLRHTIVEKHPLRSCSVNMSSIL